GGRGVCGVECDRWRDRRVWRQHQTVEVTGVHEDAALLFRILERGEDGVVAVAHELLVAGTANGSRVVDEERQQEHFARGDIVDVDTAGLLDFGTEILKYVECVQVYGTLYFMT